MAACPSATGWRRWAAFEWGDPDAARDVADAANDTSETYPSLHLRVRIRIGAGSFAEAYDLAMAAAQVARDPDERDRA